MADSLDRLTAPTNLLTYLLQVDQHRLVTSSEADRVYHTVLYRGTAAYDNAAVAKITLIA